MECQFCKNEFDSEEIEAVSSEELGLPEGGIYCLCKDCIEGTKEDVRDGILP